MHYFKLIYLRNNTEFPKQQQKITKTETMEFLGENNNGNWFHGGRIQID